MVAWRERLGLRGGTGVTIRRLRSARWYLAALKHRCDRYPKLTGLERLAVAKVAALLERGPPDAWRSHARTLQVMRELAEAGTERRIHQEGGGGETSDHRCRNTT